MKKLVFIPRKKSAIQRFMAMVDKHGPLVRSYVYKLWPDLKGSRCWLWTGAVVGGYGQFQSERAHRWSYEYHHQKKIKNYGLHKCDVELCVNPRHIFDGTAQQNMLDKVRKGRCSGGAPTGTRNGNCKLSSKDVDYIRRTYSRQKRNSLALARKFGVSQVAIWYIVNNRYRRPSDNGR